MKRIQILKLPNGREPFQEWLDSLDSATQARILTMMDRVDCGGSRKNIKPIGFGVYEIKIFIGPGYRVYFGEMGKVIILLLCGGDKNSQSSDISKAIDYWRNDESNR